MGTRAIVVSLMSICLLVAPLQMPQAQAQVAKSAVRPVAGGYLVPVAVGVVAGALIWPFLGPVVETALGFGAAATPAAGAAAVAAAPAADTAASSWLPSFLTWRMMAGGVIGGTLAYLGVR